MLTREPSNDADNAQRYVGHRCKYKSVDRFRSDRMWSALRRCAWSANVITIGTANDQGLPLPAALQSPRCMFLRDRFEHSVGHQLSISAIFWNRGAMLDGMLDLVFRIGRQFVKQSFHCPEYFSCKVVEVVPFLVILRSSCFHEQVELAVALLDPDAFDPSEGWPNSFKECVLHSWQQFIECRPLRFGHHLSPP